MNRNNPQSATRRALDTVQAFGRKVATGTAIVGATVGTAMAQTGPDVSAIEGEFTVYKVAAVGLIIAFAVVLWAKRGAGLLKPGG